MTKQKEIRNGLAIELDKCDLGDWDTWVWVETADKILSYLHSQGVAIKVDRELPVPHWEEWLKEDYTPQNWHKLAIEQMLKAGYVAVEPLIKEE